jgi:hypothetical protein
MNQILLAMRLTKAAVFGLLLSIGLCHAATLTIQNNTTDTLSIKIQSAAAPWTMQALASQQHTIVSFNHYFSARLYPKNQPTHSITTVQYSDSLGFKPNPPYCNPPYRCDLDITNPEQATLTVSNP